MDPLSLAQVITGIPQLIEYSIKSVRALRDYQKSRGNLRFSTEHAEALMFALRKYVVIVQCAALQDADRIHLEKALRNAHVYMAKLDKILATWADRLRVPGDAKIGETASAVASEIDEKASQTSDRSFSVFGKGEASCCLQIPASLQPFRLAFNKMRYMAIGSISIREALYKLEVNNKILGEFVPISQHLGHLLSYDEDVEKFTRVAKSKKEGEACLIPLSQELRLVPLEETEDPLFYKVAQRGPYQHCIVERRFADLPHEIENRKVETERIARMLLEDKQAEGGTTNKSIGILRCLGYAKPDKYRFELIFRKPKGTTARTLRKILTTPGTDIHPIDNRIEFARKLATAVHVFHSIGFVHKNIKPEAILIMEPPAEADSPFYKLGTPYLGGFTAARYNESESGMYKFDKVMNKKLYHDPRQLGRNRPEKYQMRDDIYSLGVCLLEIGLWQSVFRLSEDKKSYVVDPWASDLFADLPCDERGQLIDYDSDDESDCDENEHAVDALRKKKLIRMAKTTLNTKVNKAYCEAVVACLTFGDEDTVLPRQAGNYSGSAKFYSQVICKLTQAKGITYETIMPN